MKPPTVRLVIANQDLRDLSGASIVTDKIAQAREIGDRHGVDLLGARLDTVRDEFNDLTVVLIRFPQIDREKHPALVQELESL